LGISFPIFGFSHCRDVVIAISKAGGLGVLGTNRLAPEQLEVELAQIEAGIGSRPYSVDLLFPASYVGDEPEELAKLIPEANRQFVVDLMTRLGVPLRPSGARDVHLSDEVNNGVITHRKARQRIEVALGHSPRLFVSALGPAPPDLINRIHERGALVAGMAGSPKHAQRHALAGEDVVIAIGAEAGGHTSSISTMVLVPQVVDAVAPIPVLAGGGIATGRQLAAALALGAQGAWMGSAWLTSPESDEPPVIKEMLMAARSEDAVVSRCRTGKPVRQLNTAFVQAWEEPGAPPALQMPLQGMLVSDALAAMISNDRRDLLGEPAGQVIGLINESRSVKDIIFSIMDEFAQTVSRLTDTG